MPPRTPRYRELSLERRLEAVAFLLAHHKNGILERGKLAMVTKKWASRTAQFPDYGKKPCRRATSEKLFRASFAQEPHTRCELPRYSPTEIKA